MGKVRKRALCSVLQRDFAGLKKTGARYASLFCRSSPDADANAFIARMFSGKASFPMALRGLEQTEIEAIDRALQAFDDLIFHRLLLD